MAHHRRPAGPPASTRLSDALTRWALQARRGVRHRAGRLALCAVATTLVTGVVLAVPVVSGVVGSGPTVALDSSSSSSPRTTDGKSPVVMGLDGEPVASSTFAGVATSTDAPERAPDTSDAPDDVVVAAPVTPEPAAPPAVDAPVEEAPAAEAAPAPPVAPSQEPAPAAAPPQTSAPAAEPAADTSLEGQVLALVNAERAAVGCGAVVADSGLAAVARTHSADMRDRAFFDHVNLDGLDPFDRADRAGVEARAENIARGQDTPADVMAAWMSSPGHRANILDCGLQRLGVGVAEGDRGPWWTQLFG